MFRDLMGIQGAADGMYKADGEMVAGMGVVKGVNYLAKAPTTATATDIYFVTKDMTAVGIETVTGSMSDYEREKIVENESILLVKPLPGKIYWTDQTTGTVAVGDYLMVGTDGKFVKATSGKTSNLKVVNTDVMDAGTHKGITIEVVDMASITT